MARIETLSLEDLEGHDELLGVIQGTYGTMPNSFLTLGRVPELLEAAARLSLVVMREGKVPVGLKWMVAHVASRAAGCSYCSAHTGFHSAETAGVPSEKIEAIWEFETSPAFTDAERAALALARAASVTPNEATDEQFDELRRHFDDDEIVEIVAPIALFGFFNRWNDTLSTDLEQAQHRFAQDHLADSGWSPKGEAAQASEVDPTDAKEE